MILNGFKYSYVALNILFNIINFFFVQLNSIEKYWFIYRNLTSTMTPGQSRTGNNSIEGVLHIPPKLLGCSLIIRWFRVISRTLVGLGEGSYPSAEVQSVYSTAPADWAKKMEFVSKIKIPAEGVCVYPKLIFLGKVWIHLFSFGYQASWLWH